MSFWAMWLMIVILLAIIEFSTVNLVSIWFIISGIIAMFVSFITPNFFIQFGVFAVLGFVLMIFTKPLLDKTLKSHHEKVNLDRVVGMDGIVTEEIKKNAVGEVKVDGKLWSAISEKSIPEDTIVKIKAIDGVKLVVENTEIEKEEVVEEKKATPKKTTTSKKTATTTKKTTSGKTGTTKKKTTTTTKKGSSAKKPTSKKESE